MFCKIYRMQSLTYIVIQVSPHELYEWCVGQICTAIGKGESYKDVEAIRCSHFGEYSRQCATAGRVLSWRSSDICRKLIYWVLNSELCRY